MGEYMSKLSQPNPSSTDSSRTMPPPNSPQTHQPKPESDPETPIQGSPDPPEPEKEALQEKVSEVPAEKASGDGEGEGEEEEEEGECGFCLYMKAGGCRETFTDWEKCVDEGEKNKEDIAEKCFQATSALRKCMEAHSDYYAPLLQAEEAAVKQLEAEKERSSDQEELGKMNEEGKSDDSEKTAAS